MADTGNGRIRVITLAINGISGTITTLVAGLNSPVAVIRDLFGNFFISEPTRNRIQMLNINTNKLELIAGQNATTGDYSGDNDLATFANVDGPTGLAVHPDDDALYFSDRNNFVLRKIIATWTPMPTAFPTSIPTTRIPSAKPSLVPSLKPTVSTLPPVFLDGTPGTYIQYSTVV